jgi:hypothetical protein
MNKTYTEEEINALEEELKVYKERYNKVLNRAKQYTCENQSMRLLHSCKNNAKKQNIEFALKVEDIVIPKTCMYLGIELTNISGEGRVQSNASIDRIDSTKGYIKDNIQVISDLANKMKQNATPEQLVTFAKNILRLHS